MLPHDRPNHLGSPHYQEAGRWRDDATVVIVMGCYDRLRLQRSMSAMAILQQSWSPACAPVRYQATVLRQKRKLYPRPPVSRSAPQSSASPLAFRPSF